MGLDAFLKGQLHHLQERDVLFDELGEDGVLLHRCLVVDLIEFLFEIGQFDQGTGEQRMLFDRRQMVQVGGEVLQGQAGVFALAELLVQLRVEMFEIVLQVHDQQVLLFEPLVLFAGLAGQFRHLIADRGEGAQDTRPTQRLGVRRLRQVVGQLDELTDIGVFEQLTVSNQPIEIPFEKGATSIDEIRGNAFVFGDLHLGHGDRVLLRRRGKHQTGGHVLLSHLGVQAEEVTEPSTDAELRGLEDRQSRLRRDPIGHVRRHSLERSSIVQSALTDLDQLSLFLLLTEVALRNNRPKLTSPTLVGSLTVISMSCTVERFGVG